MIAAFIAGNFAIAAAYAAIGLYITPRFTLPASAGRRSRDLLFARVARWAALAFFLLCAATHIELATHALRDPVPAWLIGPDMVTIHLTQPVAGFTFLWLAHRHLRIQIGQRAYDREEPGTR